MKISKEHLQPNQIKELVHRDFKDVVEKYAYSETTFFYNPGNTLPNGVYFLTIKENDGPNDKASDLARPTVYRVSFKPSPEEYRKAFGEKPKRPAKGEVVDLDYDFSTEDVWMPHPIYSWMGWTMVLSPSESHFDKLKTHIDWAYHDAQVKFKKKTR